MKLDEQLGVLSGLVQVIFSLVVIMTIGIIVFSANPDLISTRGVSSENWTPKNPATDIPEDQEHRLVKYGYQLVTESSKYMGPLAKNPLVRYGGNNLSCQNCHLKAGTAQGSASFVGVSNRFPQFRGRENKMGTLAERINGCMERSMNGKAMPIESTQMKAIIAYMDWLSEDVPEEKEEEYKGFVTIEIPNIKADLVKGKQVYQLECERCHGTDGQGQRPDLNAKYVYPPLWGNDSYNHGAGMHRVITAAQFIKANMPFEEVTWDNPKLSDEEAYHVAAYINSFTRPLKDNPEADFPDKKLKPVSTPYGPWVDGFSAEQHKYGPFLPIMEWYEKELGIKKSK